MTTREQVITQAREWIGTPFQHQARVKGVACDCLGLVIGVCRELGCVAPDFDVNAYNRQPDGSRMLVTCDQYMPRVKEMQPGDMVVVSMDKDPQHVGIIAEYRPGVLSIIHALQKHGAVVETRLMFSRAMRFVAAYSLPGVQ